MGAATSQISYTASKGGVLALSRELGVQFAREGIRSFITAAAFLVDGGISGAYVTPL
jgi:NAD(P)-dependent dehydrogenase (short-subunit alcohol dehydrogenase family)